MPIHGVQLAEVKLSSPRMKPRRRSFMKSKWRVVENTIRYSEDTVNFVASPFFFLLSIKIKRKFYIFLFVLCIIECRERERLSKWESGDRLWDADCMYQNTVAAFRSHTKHTFTKWSFSFLTTIQLHQGNINSMHISTHIFSVIYKITYTGQTHNLIWDALLQFFSFSHIIYLTFFYIPE